MKSYRIPDNDECYSWLTSVIKIITLLFCNKTVLVPSTSQNTQVFLVTLIINCYVNRPVDDLIQDN